METFAHFSAVTLQDFANSHTRKQMCQGQAASLTRAVVIKSYKLASMLSHVLNISFWVETPCFISCKCKSVCVAPRMENKKSLAIDVKFLR